MSRKQKFRLRQKSPRRQQAPRPLTKADQRKARIEVGGLRRLILRMLKKGSLLQLSLDGVTDYKKRAKVRNHNVALKRAWRQMQQAQGKYHQQTTAIPATKLLHDSREGPAARSTNVKTGAATYIPWKELAK